MFTGGREEGGCTLAEQDILPSLYSGRLRGRDMSSEVAKVVVDDLFLAFHAEDFTIYFGVSLMFGCCGGLFSQVVSTIRISIVSKSVSMSIISSIQQVRISLGVSGGFCFRLC